MFVSDLPSDSDCEKIEDNGETLYLCDGVLYRSTYYEDERVYEIVSDPPEASEPESVFGLSLTEPLTRGDVVRDLQERLNSLGYDAGSPDGIFGSSTETALMWLQYDNELDPSGIVDAETMRLLGYESPPAAENAAEPAPADAGQTPEAEAAEPPETEAAPETEAVD